MPRLHALLFCSLLLPACDSSSSSPTTATTDAKSDKKGDGKADAGKAAPEQKDEATLIAAAKKAAMSQCSLPPNDFTDAKIQASEALVGSILHVWTGTGPTPREHKSFVAKQAMVRSVADDHLDIYVTTDGSDPCAAPKNDRINVATGPVVMTKDGNEVVILTIGGKKVGKYFGRTIDEVDAVVKDFKPGDKNFPWAAFNSEGRSHFEVTKLELGKQLEGKIHACLGGEDFLIGPIDAGFCPDAQATP